MERATTAVFIGHRDCYELTEEAIIPKIEEAITMGITTFLNGGMGHFDHLCAKAVDHLKAKHPEIRQVLIKPYDSLKVPFADLFDDAGLYSLDWHIEHIGFRRAIPERNEYMIQHSSVAICYVKHRSSGSYKTYQKAKDRGLTIIDIPVGDSI